MATAIIIEKIILNFGLEPEPAGSHVERMIDYFYVRKFENIDAGEFRFQQNGTTALTAHKIIDLLN